MSLSIENSKQLCLSTTQKIIISDLHDTQDNFMNKNAEPMNGFFKLLSCNLSENLKFFTISFK